MLLLLEVYPCVMELPVELGLVRVVKEGTTEGRFDSCCMAISNGMTMIRCKEMMCDVCVETDRDVEGIGRSEF
jgi:hypothetical protein